MYRKLVSTTSRIEVGESHEPINIGVRSAGEIGSQFITDLFMSKNVGGTTQPVSLHYFTRESYGTAKGFTQDKLYQKVNGTGKDFKSKVHHPWADVFTGLDVEATNDAGAPTRGTIISPYGNMPVEIAYIPDQVEDIAALTKMTESSERNIFVDTTGAYRTDEDTAKYLKYDNLLTFISAPSKTGGDIIHTLYGVNVGPNGAHVDSKFSTLLSPRDSARAYTGSCTTHAGAAVLFALQKNFPGFSILSGTVKSDHIQTPSDNEVQLKGNMIPGTTGFSSALGRVTTIPGADKFAKARSVSTRAFSDGASTLMLQMVVQVDDGVELSAENIKKAFIQESLGDMREQLAVLTPSALASHGKKGFALNSSLAMKGITLNTIIDPNMVHVDELGHGMYSISLGVMYYDNVGGFTNQFDMEIGHAATQKWGLQNNLFAPGHTWAVSKRLNFFNNGGNDATSRFGSPAERWASVGGQMFENQPEDFAITSFMEAQSIRSASGE